MWARLDDQFPDHPKVRSFGVFSLALQAASICYCSRYLTDGFISYSAADALIASVLAPFTLASGAMVTPAVTSGMSGEDATEWNWKKLMVEAGLWEKKKGGFHVHDYLDYNPERAKVLEDRAKTASRVSKFRQKKDRNAVTKAVTSNAVTNGHVTPSPSPSLVVSKETTTAIPDSGSFEEFYSVYPNRKAPEAARRAWRAALKKTSASQLMAALRRQLPEFARRPKDRVPYPATWLNGAHWLNESDDACVGSPVSDNPYAGWPTLWDCGAPCDRGCHDTEAERDACRAAHGLKALS